MPIAKYLHLSTAHITAKDAKLLDLAETQILVDFMTVHSLPGGWLVIPPTPFSEEELRESTDSLQQAGFSRVFIDITRRANQEGCWAIRFDQDEEKEHDLPVFDW